MVRIRRVSGFHTSLMSPVAMLISMFVCEAQSVEIPMKLDRRVQKGICFLLNAISLSHKDKETAVCKFLPWCFWYICWMFPASTGQGCPTHPRRGIRKWKSPWVASVHPSSVPDGQSRLPGSQQSPSLPLPHPSTQREVIYWWSGPGAVCFSLWLMGEPQTKVYRCPAPGAAQLRAALLLPLGRERCLMSRVGRIQTEPCNSSKASKSLCPFFWGCRGHEELWGIFTGPFCVPFLRCNSFPAKQEQIEGSRRDLGLAKKLPDGPDRDIKREPGWFPTFHLCSARKISAFKGVALP